MRIFFKELSMQELRRIKRAADYPGMPWRAICKRPCVARQFYRRVETEMRAEALRLLAIDATIA